MKEKRSRTDFSQHELIVKRCECTIIHHLKKPTTYTDSVKFINTNGVLLITGDYGNWVFCREFHPSKDGYVSDTYWAEKLQISSKQKPFVFDVATAQKQIAELVSNKDDYGLTKEDLDWLQELSESADDGVWAYHAKAMEYPRDFDVEMIPHGETLDYALLVVFDAFDEVCRRMDGLSSITVVMEAATMVGVGKLNLEQSQPLDGTELDGLLPDIEGDIKQ